MAKATVGSLTEKERQLIAETQPQRMRELDEDELVELHTRVRRARNKFVKVHRRETFEQVEVAGGRGTVNAGPRRSASKAEIFEDALARVSTSLARAARHSADELRAERLAMARGDTTDGSTPQPVRDDSPSPSTPRRATRRPVDRKLAAGERAQGARRQASRDAR